jgi:3-oxoacid CoA-transferase subunit A
VQSKVYTDATSALTGLLFDGMTIMAGGFGLCGIPENLITALRDSGVGRLTVIGNNVGADDHGMWAVLANGQIKKVVASYVGENKILEQRFMAGEIEIEFNPQGTLAERIRAGGAGIPAFYTRTGYGMETGLVADLSIIKAWKGDTEGNLVYRKTARNFNPVMATAGKVTVAEVEHLAEPGELGPDSIHTPAIFIDRIFRGGNYVKHIERRTTRARPVAQAEA